MVLSACAGTLDDSDGAPSAAEHDTRLGAAAGLSPRETDVLRLVVHGLSNQEIADELFLSVNSVKTYIRSAYRKGGVTTRPQAVAWCVRHGFPPPTGLRPRQYGGSRDAPRPVNRRADGARPRRQ